MRLVGCPQYIEEPWFKSGAERAKHADELDAAVGEWIGQSDLEEVVRGFEEAEAAVLPIYDASDILKDLQFQALQSIVSIPDQDLGQVKMQNVLFRMSRTPQLPSGDFVDVAVVRRAEDILSLASLYTILKK